MALASLLDAGADLDEVTAGLSTLALRGWSIKAERTTRGGLAATRLLVQVDPKEDVVERTWATIRGLLESATGLPERARRRAQEVFGGLAVAEGSVHGVSPEEVHFHEVGGLDALIDVIGTCLALESLDVSSVFASPVALGTGTVRGAHGLLPNPAPAVVELLAGVPVHGTSQTVELTTPTGAALLAGLVTSFGPLPPMKVTAAGYGAGAAELAGAPNVLQVVVGEEAAPAGALAGHAQDLLVLEANVDDVTGEVLAHTVEVLMAAGALDAWLVPALAKKGRPAHVVSVLAEPEKVAVLARALTRETGTLGFRQHQVARYALAREEIEVEVDGQAVHVKIGPHRFKAEYEDCAEPGAGVGTVLVLSLEAVRTDFHMHRLAVDLDLDLFTGQGIAGHLVLAEPQRARFPGEGVGQHGDLLGLSQDADHMGGPSLFRQRGDQPGVESTGSHQDLDRVGQHLPGHVVHVGLEHQEVLSVAGQCASRRRFLPHDDLKDVRGTRKLGSSPAGTRRR